LQCFLHCYLMWIFSLTQNLKFLDSFRCPRECYLV
jgi:hypothetical protein